ncbi:hypothetical protein TWF706_009110 [Orbilia oligospora]|nr:hypothetical protein TWF706_009110 [Orbilia oligospora]
MKYVHMHVPVASQVTHIRAGSGSAVILISDILALAGAQRHTHDPTRGGWIVPKAFNMDRRKRHCMVQVRKKQTQL